MTNKNLSAVEMKKAVEDFFAEAFCIDGNAEMVEREGFKIDSVVELNDSKRGKFYVARVSKIQ